MKPFDMHYILDHTNNNNAVDMCRNSMSKCILDYVNIWYDLTFYVLKK